MPKFWLNSTDLIDSVKRRAFIPIDQRTFSEQQILDFANEETQQNILPMIFQFHEEYLTTTAVVAITSNVQEYDVPYRAVGGKLRDLSLLDGTQPTGNLCQLVRIDPQDQVFYGGSFNSGGISRFYYMQNNSVMLSGVPTTNIGSLVFTYYQKPGMLVTEDRVATVTAMSITGTDTILSLDQVPDNITEGSLVDFLQTLPGHKTYETDYLIPFGSINNTALTITLPTADLPSQFKVRDYICTSQEAFIPQVPDELHSILAQMVAIKCLEALGDLQGMQAADGKLQQMKSVVGSLIDNRVESSPERIMNTNSLLSRSRFFRFFRSGF